MADRLKVLVFFAHPDDETMLGGGILATLAQQGAVVHFLSATRGEGGERGEPPLCEVDQLGDVREQELVCAVQALGGKSLTFLGYVDPRMGPGEGELYSFTEDITSLAGQVAATIRQFEIDIVLSHGSNGEYGHPAHLACHQAALAAVMSFDEEKRPALYTWSANYEGHPYPRLLNEDDPADLIVDIRSAWEQKIRAALCHKTQHALFTRRQSKELGRQVSVEEMVMVFDRESLRKRLASPEPGVDEMLAELLGAAPG